MKQRFIFCAIVVFAFFNATACGGSSYEFNDTEMKTLGGDTVRLQEREDLVYTREFGFGFSVPETMLEMVKGGKLEFFPPSTAAMMIIAYSDGIFDLITAIDSASTTEAEQKLILEQLDKYVFQVGAIARSSIEVDSEQAEAEIKMTYEHVQKVAETDKDMYFLAYNDDFSHLILAQGEQEKFETLVNEVKNLKDTIFVFNPVIPETTTAIDSDSYNLSLFETETLEGEPVDQSIFEDYDVTMVNVWATWCGPCINEMPDLATLHREMLPEGTNMITILTDVPDGIEAAKEIVASVEGEFITLRANDSLNGLLNTVTAIPTTVMVDSKGNIISSPILGAPPTNPAEMYLAAIQTALSTVK